MSRISREICFELNMSFMKVEVRVNLNFIGF